MDNYDLDPLWCDAYVCRVWTVPGSPVDSVFQLPTWLARPLVITLPTLRDLTSFLWRPLPAGPGSTGNKKIRSQLLGVYNLRCASLQSSLDHLKFERQKLNLCHREVKTRTKTKWYKNKFDMFTCCVNNVSTSSSLFWCARAINRKT